MTDHGRVFGEWLVRGLGGLVTLFERLESDEQEWDDDRIKRLDQYTARLHLVTCRICARYFEREGKAICENTKCQPIDTIPPK